MCAIVMLEKEPKKFFIFQGLKIFLPPAKASRLIGLSIAHHIDVEKLAEIQRCH